MRGRCQGDQNHMEGQGGRVDHVAGQSYAGDQIGETLRICSEESAEVGLSAKKAINRTGRDPLKGRGLTQKKKRERLGRRWGGVSDGNTVGKDTVLNLFIMEKPGERAREGPPQRTYNFVSPRRVNRRFESGGGDGDGRQMGRGPTSARRECVFNYV